MYTKSCSFGISSTFGTVTVFQGLQTVCPRNIAVSARHPPMFPSYIIMCFAFFGGGDLVKVYFVIF